ncbi:unnamed protein product [Brassica rapa subsp. trilocularis]
METSLLFPSLYPQLLYCKIRVFIFFFSFELKYLQYVKRFSRYKNPDAVRQFHIILSRHQLTEFELCVLGNLCPETAEEAVAMMFQCHKTKGRAHSDEAIEKMLNDLSLVKRFE